MFGDGPGVVLVTRCLASNLGRSYTNVGVDDIQDVDWHRISNKQTVTKEYDGGQGAKKAKGHPVLPFRLRLLDDILMIFHMVTQISMGFFLSRCSHGEIEEEVELLFDTKIRHDVLACCIYIVSCLTPTPNLHPGVPTTPDIRHFHAHFFAPLAG